MKKIKILNLFSGVGSNTKKLDRQFYEITHIENDEKIYEICKIFNPNDIVILDDAYSFVEKYYEKYDIIWASPPCPSHSRRRYAKHSSRKNKNRLSTIIPDFKLYSLIIFLEYHFRNKIWIIENVIPYYQKSDFFQIKEPQIIGRHYFYSNIIFNSFIIPKIHKKDYGEMMIKDWIIYLGFIIPTNPKIQIYRNCVHPQIGLEIFNQLKNTKNMFIEDKLQNIKKQQMRI